MGPGGTRERETTCSVVGRVSFSHSLRFYYQNQDQFSNPFELGLEHDICAKEPFPNRPIVTNSAIYGRDEFSHPNNTETSKPALD